MHKASLHWLKLAQARRGARSLSFLRPHKRKGEQQQHQNLPHRYQQQHQTPPPIKSPVAPEENRDLRPEWSTVAGVSWFNGGWVELGFHEERPHQVTPILLPAKQVLRENHYWGLNSAQGPTKRWGNASPPGPSHTHRPAVDSCTPQRVDTLNRPL